MLIAIDPGYARRGQGCAVALFEEGLLCALGFARPDTVPLRDFAPRAASEVVWECPQVDARTRSATPHVVQLAAVGGTLAGMYAGACACRAVAIPPTTWKGATPKPVHHARMWRALCSAEQTMLGGAETRERIEQAARSGALDRWGKPGASYYPVTWDTHNLLDAVGLGLWRLRRVDRDGIAI